MKGMSERRYAAHCGLSRGAVQKAKATGRLVLHDDGSIDAVASDTHRPETTDPAKSRPAKVARKPVPKAAVEAVGETLREQGLPAPASNSGTTLLQARTANEVLKVQEGKIRLARLKGDLVDKDSAVALVFRLARQERDAWVGWPARVAALMAAELGAQTALMQKVLEAHVRAHLDELAEPDIEFV